MERADEEASGILTRCQKKCALTKCVMCFELKEEPVLLVEATHLHRCGKW